MEQYALDASSPMCYKQLGGVGYVKTQLSSILLYYIDNDMFRQLWVIFRPQKYI